MKNRSGEKIKLTSIDELLGVVNEESAMEIEINRIHAFKDHPFKVLDDEKMADLVESVKVNGVLTPVLLRADGEDGYEMISGHRRMHAAVMAGCICGSVSGSNKYRNDKCRSTTNRNDANRGNSGGRNGSAGRRWDFAGK